MNLKNASLVIALAVSLVACDKKDTPPAPAVVSTRDFLVNGSPSGGNYNFFRLENSSEIPFADSNTVRWDFAMRFETFIVNSNASGPGQAGVQVINQPFDAVTTAPETGYRYDTSAAQKAIKGSDWYTYNAATRTFAPIAGKTFVFRTATGQYAKLEILSADPADDFGNLVTPPTRPTKIKYRIRSAYQGNGTRQF